MRVVRLVAGAVIIGGVGLFGLGADIVITDLGFSGAKEVLWALTLAIGGGTCAGGLLLVEHGFKSIAYDNDRQHAAGLRRLGPSQSGSGNGGGSNQ